MSSHTEGKAEDRFSVSLFAITIAVSLGIFYAVAYLIAPKALVREWHAGWLAFALVFLAIHLACSFVEFFFHRYVLHMPAVPGLGYFYRQHTLHHGLTFIRPPRKGNGVENKFPIIEEEQHEASYFPFYSLFVFGALATPAFVIAHLLAPSLPWLLAGYASIAWSLSLYEILHAIEHMRNEFWEPLLEHRRYGGFWKLVYGFHLRHHADIRSNESISGFFGFPVPDLVFGTWVNPQTLYEHGRHVEKKEFASPRPIFLIRWLDRLADAASRNRRLKAQHAAERKFWLKAAQERLP